MTYLTFELRGDMAMWRNPYESMGSFSCLGPAPSNLAGLFGAALGFATSKSQALEKHDDKKSRQLDKKGLPWPVSEELLEWQIRANLKVACRWKKGFPKRIAWNINGCKELDPAKENLRLQQQVIDSPCYEVAVEIAKDEAKKLAEALKSPAFPLCLGASFCRAIITNIIISEEKPEQSNWAFYKDGFAVGDSVPFSQHIINAEATGERIKSTGFWVYPIDESTSEILENPFVKTYCELEV
ncbi:MAG: CRISPR-associated protein Cas5 [Verrucomicrobiota bacterium]|nr:CRISPR-associated protein Cas5 [Verrucomicrobiota bacterium]